MACNIEIISRGVAPIAFNAFTTSPTLAVAGNTITFALSSFTSTFVLLVTTVDPPENGGGWDTSLVFEIRMLSPPCATATSSMDTFCPITMVPVRSLITILATLSGLMVISSRAATKATKFPSY